MQYRPAFSPPGFRIHSCRKSHRTAGFTLIEVLLALAIFSIVIVGSIQSLNGHVRAEKYAEDTTRAVILAQNLIEEVRYSGAWQEEAQEGQFEEENTGFAWNYEIQATEVENLFLLTVEITWNDAFGSKNYETATLLSASEDPNAKASNP
jgi:type II secretion system protein I